MSIISNRVSKIHLTHSVAVVKIWKHFLLHCPNYSNERSSFLSIMGNIDRNILAKCSSQVTKKTIPYGNSYLNNVHLDFKF